MRLIVSGSYGGRTLVFPSSNRPAVSDQYHPVILGRPYTVIMGTPRATFDMADFVDWGEVTLPDVSHQTDLDVSETPLNER